MIVHELAHFELINWARWCWLGRFPHPLPPEHCASYEHHYLAPSDLGDSDAPPSRILPNAQNARRVQAIYDALPETQRQVIRAEYPQFRQSGRAEHGRHWMARHLGIAVSEYDYALQVVSGLVMEEFA